MTTNFSAFETKINEFLASDNAIYHLSKIKAEQLLLLSQGAILKQSTNTLIFAESSQEVDSIYNFLTSLITSDNHLILKFNSHAEELYDGMYPSDSKFFSQLYAQGAFHLSNANSCKVIVTDYASILHRFPPIDTIKNNSINININDNLDSDDVSEFLVDLGYTPSIDIDEPGTFLNKGEVLDLYPTNSDRLRIYFDIDKVERIKILDSSIEHDEVNSANISYGYKFIFSGTRGDKLKTKIPTYDLGKKELLLRRREILSQIKHHTPFQNHQYFHPCAFESSLNIYDFFNVNVCINTSIEQNEQKIDLILDKIKSLDITSVGDVLPIPDDVLFCELPSASKIKQIFIKNFNEIDNNINETTSIEDINHFFKSNIDQYNDEPISTQKIDLLSKLIRKGFSATLCSKNEKAIKEILNLLDERKSASVLTKSISLESGFIDHSSRDIYFSDQDIFRKKIPTHRLSKPRENDDLFAEQIATLNIGDYVIHKTHGLGKYLGLKEMDSMGTKSDYIVIEYDKDDKVYLPIYRINEVQKHASGESTSFRLANLRTKNFLLQKKKIQNSIKKLAFDLVQLQAKRALTKAFRSLRRIIYMKTSNYHFLSKKRQIKFEPSIEFLKTCKKTFQWITSCGDVGFGKTEVAIRAAFKAVVDNKQVAVLVPTTILALQHFNSFTRRLRDTGAVIKVMTRFQTKKENEEIINKIKDGKIDILIGTHKILSDKVNFHDLGTCNY